MKSVAYDVFVLLVDNFTVERALAGARIEALPEIDESVLAGT